MGTVLRKMATKPLPAGAEIVVNESGKLARWRDARGKLRTAPLVHGRDDRIKVVAKTYTAKYRDGSGQVREVATGCRDKSAAQKVLSDLKKRAENVKSRIHTAGEDAAIDHQRTPLDQHFLTYQQHQTAKGNDSVRIANDKSRFERLTIECGWRQLSDLTGDSLATWLANRAKDGMSAGNRNEFRQVMVGFANWCIRTNRLMISPFVNVPKADAKSDQRRKRRALAEPELLKLLDVAQRRPMEEALMIRRGKDKGKLGANVRPEVREQLELLGRERALIYKTLVLTGLRKNELASLTIGQLYLDGPHPYADLAPEDEKNREGSQIALRRDLADELAEWIKDIEQRTAKAAVGCVPLSGAKGRPISGTRLFNVPTGLLRILDRDLIAAGIPKRDERGRTVDVHAMRHSFGTLLSKGGVAPRTAQAAMRHSTIDLTMNTYTDPKLLDVHGALDALPSLPLGRSDAEPKRATGTADLSPFAPAFAPKSRKASQSVSKGDKQASWPAPTNSQFTNSANVFADKEKQPVDNTCQRAATSGAEGSRTLDLCIAKTRAERRTFTKGVAARQLRPKLKARLSVVRPMILAGKAS
jgi:integrase